MSSSLPLATLLSHALVAFTIEFDNEAEHRMPHRTTSKGPTPGALYAPWLVSLAMWENCMRHLPDDGLPLHELEHRARTPANLPGMQRWRYITVAPAPGDPRPKPPRSAWVARPTPAGRMARQVWQPLAAEVEARWELRFGETLVTSLRKSLHALDLQLDPGLPDCMPILGYGLFSRPPDPRLPPPDPDEDAVTGRPLYALLARVLLSFAIEFEKDFVPSLAICANLLRVLDDKGVRVRDLPDLSGVSKEALQMAMGIAGKAKLVILEPNPDGSPFKIARLGPRGLVAQDAYRRRLRNIEDDWNNRYGGAIAGLRAALEPLALPSKAGPSPLFQCIEPHPGNWRASVRKPSTLPHFPMVLHRGGYPDGS